MSNPVSSASKPDPVHTFCDLAGVINEDQPYSLALCGPDSLSGQALNSLLSGGSTARQKFLDTLTKLDQWLGTGIARPTDHGDNTISARWEGLSRVMRWCLMKDSQDLRVAKKAFDDVWNVANPDINGDQPTLTLYDGTSADQADKAFYSTVKTYLQPWTGGSWLIWDMLCQINNTAMPVAEEKTSVLFGGGQGQVMQLVVEALPGPAGLVTPNFWKLGLIAFPNNNQDRYLVHSIQRIMQLSASPEVPLRLRWHLDATDRGVWRFGLDGRSLEAAAASVALAVFELYEELKQDENKPAGNKPSEKKSDKEPILDPQVAVTAEIDTGNSLALKDRPLKWVTSGTLQAKLDAAASMKIDVIGVATKQPRQGAVIPPGIRIEELATVDEALDLLRSVNRALDRYADYVRRQFRYYEEETPPNK